MLNLRVCAQHVGATDKDVPDTYRVDGDTKPARNVDTGSRRHRYSDTCRHRNRCRCINVEYGRHKVQRGSRLVDVHIPTADRYGLTRRGCHLRDVCHAKVSHADILQRREC